MQISQLLRHKGQDVATIEGGETVRTALEMLARLGIWALVVSADGKRIDGIVSERDVARGLHEKVFAWMIQGDERNLAATYVAGSRMLA